MDKAKLKKVSHIWSVLCSSSSIDAEKNNITLINVLEQITLHPNEETKSIPKGAKKIINISFELVSFWKKNDTEEEVNIEGEAIFLDPHGERMGSLKFPIKIKNPTRRLRSRLQFKNLQVVESGDYTWQIKVRDGDTDYVATEIPLEIKVS